ncbi:MAG: hypothetical protein AB7D05_01115 [Mangrovibacterium sp.]
MFLIVNCAEPGVREFARPLSEILDKGGFSSFIAAYRDCSVLNLSSYEGIVLSGSPRGDDIAEHHQPYFSWLLDYENPVLGICAGHHIAGCLYGASLLRGEEAELGATEIVLLEEDPLFQGFGRKLIVHQMHNDSISLPPEFMHLARSETCMNQAMRHKKKPLYSVQFHPEFCNPEILLNFARMCRER